MLPIDSSVRHARYGVGKVIVDDGRTVVVQFPDAIQRCLPGELTPVTTPLDRLGSDQWDAPLPTVARILSEAIESTNNRWGVFSYSRIALLPHQLWVCRKVLETWPTRWLVADDVGLGKTIEAGLILWPILARGSVRRLLVLCPASLVPQWQQRLRTMFDIRLAPYVAEADTATSDFWHTHPTVVASLQTLRQDGDENRGKKAAERRKRLYEAPPWDLLIVDEAHHLNAEDKGGPTLGYQLVEELMNRKRIGSAVFFTGTPHRGKNFGFLALLKLLRPDLFDPAKPIGAQLAGLRQVMIRNNKQDVTDLKGTRLFEAPRVTAETYSYSTEEAAFYDMLTEFIVSGKAYASNLGLPGQRTAMLVLIAMQKLASSSVAAIRRALDNRLKRLRSARPEPASASQQRELLFQYEELEQQLDTDELNLLDEQVAESPTLEVVANEVGRLEQLLEAADRVKSETKIAKLLESLEGQFKNRTVLFFTEYKATQSLLMSVLIERYGEQSVAFINGDGRAEGVLVGNQRRTLQEERAEAARRFNAGEVAYLVSTEAAGEGIDLQKNCHTLIHVDLPWNPMRLHQRVGRLYRYGQKQRVDVLSLRNPGTVESDIWDKLEEKIREIMGALREVMDQPEDLRELVLGMTSSALFREIFSEAASVPALTLDSWFDSKTARLGGQDVMDAVKGMVGNCARFDFQECSERIPKLDLPALRPFFLSMLAYATRRVQESEAGLSFKTPDAWMKTPSARESYRNMVFCRSPEIGLERVLGIGHAVFNEALTHAKTLEATVAAVTSTLLPQPIFVFKISERLTTESAMVRSVIAAARVDEAGSVELFQDWQLVDFLNGILERRTLRRDAPVAIPAEAEALRAAATLAQQRIEARLASLDVSFKVPETQLFAVLVPFRGEAPAVPGADSELSGDELSADL